MVKTSNTWFDEINYLRALAIIGVLIIHTTDDTASVGELTGLTFSLMYIEELVRFAVPMFVFVSGFVLYNKYKAELPMKEFFQKRLTVILIPYIIFSVLYCIFNAKLGSFQTLTSNSVIVSILNFNASGHFWYIQLILTLYILYPVIIAYYEITKNHFGIHTLCALFLSILIMYFLVYFVPSFRYSFGTLIQYLIYFLFGIYINDNYDHISQSFERLSLIKTIILSISILIIPFFSMVLVLDQRCGTQFSNFILFYHPLKVISENILHLFIFILCLHLFLRYKPKIRILQKIGEYSYGIFIIHVFFHNFLLAYLFPRFSIFPTSLKFYIILFTVMLIMSYFSVKLMLTNYFTTYMITGKINTDRHST